MANELVRCLWGLGSNWAPCLIASRSQSGGNVSSLTTLSKAKQRFHCSQDHAFKEVQFWWDEGQNLIKKRVEISQDIIHSGQSQSKWKGSGKEHIHLIASNFFTRGCAWRIIVSLCHSKKSKKKFHWLFQYELNEFSYLFLEKNRTVLTSMGQGDAHRNVEEIIYWQFQDWVTFLVDIPT